MRDAGCEPFRVKAGAAVLIDWRQIRRLPGMVDREHLELFKAKLQDASPPEALLSLWSWDRVTPWLVERDEP